MGNLWTRFKGLFSRKAPPPAVIPEVDFKFDTEQNKELDLGQPPVVMLEGVVPMPPAPGIPITVVDKLPFVEDEDGKVVPNPELARPVPLIDLSWSDIGEAADQALPIEEIASFPLQDFRKIERIEPGGTVVSEPVAAEPTADAMPEAPQADPEPEPAQEPVQAEAPPVPIVALVEPVPEPAVPDQSEGWLARLWDKVGPEEGEGLAAPAKIAPLLVDPLEDQPVPNWVGGGQLGFLHARVSMGGI